MTGDETVNTCFKMVRIHGTLYYRRKNTTILTFGTSGTFGRPNATDIIQIDYS